MAGQDTSRPVRPVLSQSACHLLKGGKVVEQGPSLEVIRYPKDDYTQLLLDAIPNPFEDATR